VAKLNRLIAIAAAMLLYGCSQLPNSVSGAPTPFALPVAHSNNAVAIADGTNEPTLFSFNGLRSGKRHAGISAPMPNASMDHRGLLLSGDKAYIVGGMDSRRGVWPILQNLRSRR